MTKLENIKVALVHDWLVSRGGGERALYYFHLIFPSAPIYTLVYDEKHAPEWCRGCDIRTTYIQDWPGGKSHHKLLLKFMPKAWEELDLSEYDLVLSSCSSCCKGVITRPDAVHICYCHSPIRYVWDLYYEYLRGADPMKQFFMRRWIHDLRVWDFQAAQRVDYFLCNSDYVRRRIRKYYRRNAQVMYSGIPIDDFPINEERDDYYLVVSRFVRYKRIDIALEACNKLKKKLIVVGSGGEEEKKLRAIAGPTVEFVGRASDKDVQEYYRHARALLFPGIEDLGLTPIEAQAGGTPVLAYGKGGALETVINGETGLFFYEQSSDALAECMLRFESMDFSAKKCHQHATKFSDEAFIERIRNYCLAKLSEGDDDIVTRQ